MAVIRIMELSGSSHESWSDAVERAVVEATRLLQPMIDTSSSKREVSNVLTRVDEYTATICVAFIVKDLNVPALPLRTGDVRKQVDLPGEKCR
jgi:flavin-binding protein dodecin